MPYQSVNLKDVIIILTLQVIDGVCFIINFSICIYDCALKNYFINCNLKKKHNIDSDKNLKHCITGKCFYSN